MRAARLQGERVRENMKALTCGSLVDELDKNGATMLDVRMPVSTVSTVSGDLNSTISPSQHSLACLACPAWFCSKRIGPMGSVARPWAVYKRAD